MTQPKYWQIKGLPSLQVSDWLKYLSHSVSQYQCMKYYCSSVCTHASTCWVPVVPGRWRLRWSERRRWVPPAGSTAQSYLPSGWRPPGGWNEEGGRGLIFTPVRWNHICSITMVTLFIMWHGSSEVWHHYVLSSQENSTSCSPEAVVFLKDVHYCPCGWSQDFIHNEQCGISASLIVSGDAGILNAQVLQRQKKNTQLKWQTHLETHLDGINRHFRTSLS